MTEEHDDAAQAASDDPQAMWDARYQERPALWGDEPNVFVRHHATALPPGTALDLGCGDGRHAVWLAREGWEVTAADFSSVALARGAEVAEHLGVEVTWLERDVTRWAPPARAFDLVLLAYLHLPSATFATVLRDAVDAVAPGGHLLLVGHHADNLEHGVGGPPDPDLLQSEEQVLAALEGLTIHRAEQATRPVTGDDGVTRDALDLVVLAQRPDARG